MKLDIQIISVKKEQLSAKGGFSKYYKIDENLGVKVYNCKGYNTIDQLYNSRKWVDALTEYIFYHQAQVNTKMSPQKVSIVIVRKDKRLYPGIVMEHIDGIAYESYRLFGIKLYVNTKGEIQPEKTKNSQELMTYVKKTLKEEANIRYLDKNFENFIIEDSGKIRVIDFTPSLCRMDGLF